MSRALHIRLILALLLTPLAMPLSSAAQINATVLHQFAGGSEGRNPQGGVVRTGDGTLYGTTQYGGGTNDLGTVFKVTSGGQFTNLYSFGGPDGGQPMATVVQASDGNFYGTTYLGGAYGFGEVFRITPAGQLSVLHSFSGPDGINPIGGLIQASDGNLYGTASAGGADSGSYGTIFKISLDGQFTLLHSFAFYEGATPESPPTQGTDGNFYGVTTKGGGKPPTRTNAGSIYKMAPDGTTTGLYVCYGSDCLLPHWQLTELGDGNFYGSSLGGIPTSNYGSVFRITPSGTYTQLVEYDVPSSVTGSPSTPVLPLSGSLYYIGFGPGYLLKGSANGGADVVYQPGAGMPPSPTGVMALDSAGNIYGADPGITDSSYHSYGTVVMLTPSASSSSSGGSSSSSSSSGSSSGSSSSGGISSQRVIPTKGGNLLVTTSAGTLSQGQAVLTPSAAPADYGYPDGFISYTITGLSNGQSVTVKITTPAGTAPAAYVKCNNSQCAPFPGTSIAGDQITLTLVDGGAGDNDGAVNGTIVEPGAPAVPSSSSGSSSSSSSSSSGSSGSSGSSSSSGGSSSSSGGSSGFSGGSGSSGGGGSGAGLLFLLPLLLARRVRIKG